MKISKQLAEELGEKYNINFNVVKFDEWHYGLNVELEHGTKLGSLTNITNNDPDMTTKIVIAHLLEGSDYYRRLYKMEEQMEKYWAIRKKYNIFNK